MSTSSSLHFFFIQRSCLYTSWWCCQSKSTFTPVPFLTHSSMSLLRVAESCDCRTTKHSRAGRMWAEQSVPLSEERSLYRHVYFLKNRSNALNLQEKKQRTVSILSIFRLIHPLLLMRLLPFVLIMLIGSCYYRLLKYTNRHDYYIQHWLSRWWLKN